MKNQNKSEVEVKKRDESLDMINLINEVTDTIREHYMWSAQERGNDTDNSAGQVEYKDDVHGINGTSFQVKLNKELCSSTTLPLPDFCVKVPDGKAIVIHPTKVIKGVVEDFLRMDESDANTPCEKVNFGQLDDITNKEVLTFEQCMEKYGKYMSSEKRAELWVNALRDNPDDKELHKAWKEWLFPKSDKKEKLNNALTDYLYDGRSVLYTNVNTKKERTLADNQLKNLAPLLSGNSVIKSDDADNPVGHLTINNRYYGVVHLKEDFVFSKTDGVCQIKNVVMSVENSVHDVWYDIGSDKEVHSSNIERKATEQEIINHLSPYKIHQYITTGFNNRVQQITDKKLNDKNQVIYELDSIGIYLVESVINRVAEYDEVIEQLSPYKVGEFVLLLGG